MTCITLRGYDAHHINQNGEAMSKRITITLTPELYSALHAHSEEMGVSISSVVREYMTAAIPVLNQVTETMKKAKKASELEKKRMRLSLDNMAK